MSSKPKVSVVLPVYNRIEYLRQAIESILSQTFQDLELIIVDDRSTNPEVLKIAKPYEAENDNVRVIARSENGGLSVSCNTGIENAKGEYIARMDDDDISLPKRIATQYEFLCTHPEYAAVGTNYNLIDSEGKLIKAHTPYNTPFISSTKATAENLHHSREYILNPTAMFRRQALIAIGGYRSWFRTADDLDITLRLEEKHPIGRIVSEALYAYRTHNTHKLSVKPSNYYATIVAFISAWYRRNGLDDPLKTSVTLDEALNILKTIDMAEDVRIELLRKAFGHCRRMMRVRDYNSLLKILKVCAYCIREKDTLTLPLLKKLHRRIFKRMILYGRFGWMKHHFSACQIRY